MPLSHAASFGCGLLDPHVQLGVPGTGMSPECPSEKKKMALDSGLYLIENYSLAFSLPQDDLVSMNKRQKKSNMKTYKKHGLQNGVIKLYNFWEVCRRAKNYLKPFLGCIGKENFKQRQTRAKQCKENTKKVTTKQCTPQSGISASLFSMPNLGGHLGYLDIWKRLSPHDSHRITKKIGSPHLHAERQAMEMCA